MTKVIVILLVLFTVSNAVLYGRDVTGKEELPQGYRYNRPAPHYLPPYQETSTQASNHYYGSPTPTPASQQQHWQQQSWMSNNFGSTNSFVQPTLAPSREKPFMGSFRPHLSAPSNNHNEFNGYNYQNSPSQAVFVTTVKPYVDNNNQQMPSSGYYYMQQSQNSKPVQLPVTDVTRPNSSGYNYMQPQATNPTNYYYNKPEKNSYNPASLPNSGYVGNTPANNNYYNQAYDLSQAQATSDFSSHASSSYVTPTFPTSLASSGTAMTSYQRPNYGTDYSASTSIDSVPLAGGHHEPWYMNQKIESTNNYNNNHNNNNNNWNLPQHQQQQQQQQQQQIQQFRPTSPPRNYLPPKLEFQPPYYKK